MDIELFPETLATEAFLLVCSFVLSGIIGLERELRRKSAGARTHILVGMGSALFTLVSAYGFQHVLGDDVVLDPSRIAAQIVTGIGFLGAGVIFVRRNIISGLTTAASVWVTAAVGMACGAGMPVIAALTVALYVCGHRRDSCDSSAADPTSGRDLSHPVSRRSRGATNHPANRHGCRL